MQAVSTAWKNNQTKTILNESFVEASLNIADPDALLDVSAQDNGATHISNTSQVVGKVDKDIPPYATLEQNLWVLDGKRKVLPVSDFGDSGYIGDALSDANCGFSNKNPVLTLNFTRVHANPVPAVTIVWGQTYNEFAEDFVVTVYNGDTVVAQKEVIGNKNVNAVVRMDFANYDRITITILRWCLPHHRARIDEVFVGLRKVFTKTDLFSYKHSQTVDPLSTSLPKAEVVFSVDNTSNLYNPHIPVEASPEYVSNGLIMWCDGRNNTGTYHKDNVTTWVDLSGNGNHLMNTNSLATTAPAAKVCGTWEQHGIALDSLQYQFLLTQTTFDLGTDYTLEIRATAMVDDYMEFGFKTGARFKLRKGGAGWWVRVSESNVTDTRQFQTRNITQIGVPVTFTVARSYDAATDKTYYTIYENGVYLMQGNCTGNHRAGEISVAGIGFERDNLTVHSFRVYNRALSAEEIKFNYESDKLYLTTPEVPTENDASLAKYLLERQEIRTRYGSRLDDGNIEWIKGGTFFLSEWNAAQNGNDAQFTARDILEYLGGKYVDVPHSGDSRALYDLAEGILIDANLPVADDGTVRWVIDASLRNIYTSAPLPDDTRANCLLLIANAARCVFYQDRDGVLHIEPMTDKLIAADDWYSITQFNSYKKPELKVGKPLAEICAKVYSYTLGENGIESSTTDYILSVGNKGERVEIDNPLIVDETLAAAVCAWIWEYAAHRVSIDMSWRPDVRLDALDIIKVTSTDGTNLVRITDVEYSFGGAFNAKSEGRVM